MSVKRIHSPEAALILRELDRRAVDYRIAATVTGLHPTTARRHLEALHAAGLIYIAQWQKDRTKTGPWWPLFELGRFPDAAYPAKEIKQQRRTRRQLRERPHATNIFMRLLGRPGKEINP